MPDEEEFPYALRLVSDGCVQRLHLDGLGLRLDPVADGRRCR